MKHGSIFKLNEILGCECKIPKLMFIVGVGLWLRFRALKIISQHSENFFFLHIMPGSAKFKQSSILTSIRNTNSLQ
jgi:hypothetical protein